jgi:natural product biosynthesis luciferase-like monooxygenase protein
MQFSLFYFSDDGSTTQGDKYRLLIESAQFADRNGFAAVWIPERHFHPFGGLYPSSSVLSAALAMVTRQVQLRAGSVVLPLQHPIRVAEEWSIVDSLSQGRVALAFASGWHIDDFVLAPGNYADRKTLMWQGIETVRRLWAGEAIEQIGESGTSVTVKTFPRPVQSQLPIWITCQSPETFVLAGKMGANVLTALLHETTEDIARKVALYRQARSQHGYDPQAGTVALMLHTFLGEEMEAVKAKVKIPFCNYLKTNLDLLENLLKQMNVQVDLKNFGEDDIDSLLEFGYERYLDNRTLIGTFETGLSMVDRVYKAGINEIACLIDFGLDVDSVMTSLHHLHRLQQHCRTEPALGDRLATSHYF